MNDYCLACGNQECVCHTIAKPRSIDRMSGVYADVGMNRPSVRPGADDHQQYPSRMGKKLIYRDGNEGKV
jgi:hypothetical protein